MCGHDRSPLYQSITKQTAHEGSESREDVNEGQKVTNHASTSSRHERSRFVNSSSSSTLGRPIVSLNE
jgi:hypothetical protein